MQANAAAVGDTEYWATTRAAIQSLKDNGRVRIEFDGRTAFDSNLDAWPRGHAAPSSLDEIVVFKGPAMALVHFDQKNTREYISFGRWDQSKVSFWRPFNEDYPEIKDMDLTAAMKSGALELNFR